MSSIRKRSGSEAPRARALGWIVPVVCLLSAGVLANGAGNVPSGDTDRVLGPQACAECHTSEFEVWRATPHQTDSKLLTRDTEARRIAKALGIRRLKVESRCTSCHFTMQQAGENPKAVAGVSCESCHGAARDWIEYHDDFGGEERSRETETAEHRAERLNTCDEMGMIRAGRLASMARQCLRCHMIADEELVNVAGHPTGAGFELVSWSQGPIRHNFVRSDGKVNAQSSPERRRLMFVVGQILELEYAVTGLAGTSGQGDCADALRDRATSAIEVLRSVCEAAEVPEADMLMAEVQATSMDSLNGETLGAFVATIEECLMKIETMYDGVGLDGLDGLIADRESLERREDE